ncbi:type I pantothenate kinase [Sphingobacterium sp. UT-1RO-CII-1]|uniref:type I pantothenate kinase n=1 Tax=Sphingobacterium sp. UT-1RO-CII-1 TaxID=2995225 RepID=UPI00227C8789|nr:type I pantothenate kinase [Sphingobacterium sp. UT-1RO-CII-1]MCY4779209.1 type I pantothenate kinase [Sphingobacterium sp. UT-1RO-CII-1]
MSLSENSEFNGPFQEFEREHWKGLNGDFSYRFTAGDLEYLSALNEPLNISEIEDIYFPLAHYLSILIQQHREAHSTVNRFLNQDTAHLPFILGIAGSVAVGKSTTARVLQKVLSMLPGKPKVDLVTTDGFLYPNDTLINRGILNRKGFPESYDAKLLLQFLAAMKTGVCEFQIPVYSHLEYDILKNEVQTIAQPDILIVEGINVLQVSPTKENTVFVSDYFDYSIYVDAAEKDIIDWYIKRFESLRATSFQNKSSYFHRYADMSQPESNRMATTIWNEINGPNLHQNILPTRYRAGLILQKGSNHFIEKVKVRKV